MNQINYNQTGGFPLDTNILDFGQKANQITQELGGIINPLAIIKGCETNGTYVGDGIVFIHGEILPFRGGTNTGRVIIQEEYEGRQFEGKPTLDNVLVTRTACFGETVSVAYQWSNFYRPIKISEIERRLVHVGFIQDYYGSVDHIPQGWYLCNGEHGTPDLRGRFIVGHDPYHDDYNTIGKTGGEKSVTLSKEQMPIHKHDGSTSNNGGHFHYLATGLYSGNKNLIRLNTDNAIHVVGEAMGDGHRYQLHGNNDPADKGRSSNSGAHSHTFDTNDVGGSQAHENRPPFYTLAKIIFKG